MDFQLTKEQRDIQQAAREFVQAEYDKDKVMQLELNHEYPTELWKKSCQQGFLGIDFPDEYGGQGYGLMETVLVQEEFARQFGGIGLAVVSTNMGAATIFQNGTEEQKKKYLPPIFNGEAHIATAVSEPDHGSDITFLDTSAVKDGEDYVINGVKTFITNANIAKWTIILCQTNPEAKPGYRGQTNIIVEMDRPGIELSDLQKMGWKSAPTFQVFLTNVRVPQENLLGEENRGFYQFLRMGNNFRVQAGATALGMAQGAFDRALDYAKTREAFGQKIGKFQVIQHKLVDMFTKVETARLVVYKAASEIGQGRTDPTLCSMAKWYPCRMAVEVCDEAIEILGGHGYMLENEVERFYRDAKAAEIADGMREIQKNTIATALLGKELTRIRPEESK
ncbi:acyl-CoA dehydrogenase family protein [Chloroflexota bacterium]